MGRTPTARQSAAGETISKQRVKWRVLAASRWWMLGWEKTFEIELKPNCAAADEGQRERGAVAPRLCRHRSYARAVHQDIRHGILAPGLKAAEEIRARHHHAACRENRTKEAAIASLARMKAEAELASLYRERAIARAWAARRDPKKKSRRFRRLLSKSKDGWTTPPLMIEKP